ncbi:hypothetical protein TELCIR_18610 [Teladorsagia circumcincta]|uniref:G-protein coupled receptors family 1 profile domain-containing protein n=1 Tax=Teladorsagia circumcincta TaxID=45464 RepID=A0A2G9TPH4_TELCI|nr:hypothetical protein TELCIR_18610 [Teladorsagia circumcincta]
MEETTMKYIRYCVVSEILFFNVIGVFGNVQLLWATFRKQSTHSKPGESATCRESQKAIRSLKVIVVIFVFSWYMAILGVNFGYILRLSPSVLAIYQSNMHFREEPNEKCGTASWVNASQALYTGFPEKFQRIRDAGSERFAE